MTETMKYWVRILGAITLIKMATTLVRDAERLITANVKARNPEIIEEVEQVVLHEFEVSPGSGDRDNHDADAAGVEISVEQVSDGMELDG